MTISTAEESRVYVGTYAKYNSGNLKGAWLDLADYPSADEFFEHCAIVHDDEIDPEFMFQDWENIPCSLMTESSISEHVWDWLAIDDDMQRHCLGWVLDNVTDTIDFDCDTCMIIDDDCRECDKLKTIGEHEVYERDMFGHLDERVKSYLDFESIGRDLDIENSYYLTDENILFEFVG